MATLTNTKIKDTYKSLLKVSDNGNLEAGLQEITDGEGNASGVQLNTGGDLTASGTVAFGSLKDSGENITIAKFVDEADGIALNDNDTSIPTSAAVKDYVDTKVTAEDLDFAGDTGTGAVDLDSQTFTIAGTANEIETSASGQTITIGLPNDVSISGNLAVDTDTLYVDAANNRVGIGTSSPATPLSVVGDATLSAGSIRTDNNEYFFGKTSGGTSIRLLGINSSNVAYIGAIEAGVASTIFNASSTSATASFYTSGSERMRINQLGNIGIGTSAPPNVGDYSVVDITGRSATNGGMVLVATSDASGEGRFYCSNTQIIVDDAASGSDLYLKTNGANALQFGTSNTERMRIDSSGYVGIGTSSPSVNFEVRSTSQAAIRVRSDAGSITDFGSDATGTYFRNFSPSKDTFRFLQDDGTESMRIDSSGNVGIGTSSPSVKLDVDGGNVSNPARFVGTSDKNLWIYTDSGGTGIGTGTGGTGAANYSNLIYLNDTDSNTRFFTAGSERMRITSGGELCIGRTSPKSSAQVSFEKDYGTGNAIVINTTNTTTSYVPLNFQHNGTLVGYIASNTTSTSYNTSSDYRLKENVVEMTGALDRVDALKPSRFNFIADPETIVDGFLAHEVAQVVPEAITGEKDAVDEEGNPIYQGIDQSKIVPLLVGAIKELRAEIETFKSQLNA